MLKKLLATHRFFQLNDRVTFHDIIFEICVVKNHVQGVYLLAGALTQTGNLQTCGRHEYITVFTIHGARHGGLAGST